jgi:hypothetical protein
MANGHSTSLMPRHVVNAAMAQLGGGMEEQ